MPDDPDGSDRFTLPDETFELRDGRQPGWFWCQNALFDARPDLPPHDKLLYLALCRRAGPEGTSFPSIQRLVQDTGLSRATVYRALARLKAARLLQVDSGQASGHVNHYRIVNPSPSPTETRPSPTETGVSHRETGGVSQRDGGVSQREIQKDDSSEGRLREGQEDRPPATGGPPVARRAEPHRNGHHQAALAVLAFLNDRAGKHFRPGKATTGFIEARLKAGASVQDCKTIIVRKVRAWQGDPKTQEWLRPKTLFNETNFAQYQGDLTPEEADDGLPELLPPTPA